jgi:hypothetical protein
VSQRPGDLVPQDAVWPALWPEQVLQLIPGDACAMLAPRDGDSPTVRLVRDEVEDARPEGVTVGSSAVRVEPGHGALFTSGGFESTRGTSPYLIDAKGLAYRVDDPTTLEHLGFADTSIPVIPDTWLRLFSPGPVLSADAVGRHPVDAAGPK